MKNFNTIKEINNEIIIYKNMLKHYKSNNIKSAEINQELDRLNKLKLGLRIILRNKNNEKRIRSRN
jgi:hypothetical protein